MFDLVFQDPLLCTQFMQFDFELFTANGALIAPPFHLSEPQKKNRCSQGVLIIPCLLYSRPQLLPVD